MNKQELIKAVEELPANCRGLRPMIDKWSTLELIKLLDEPQPVKVPQFVADWHEKKKHDLDYYIWDYIYNWNHQEESEFKRWMDCSIISFQTLVNMHQFGYEVEKEKRYLVKIRATKHYIAKDGTGKIFFSLAYKGGFTKKQLEDLGFGWVFDCPGIEIEEVE